MYNNNTINSTNTTASFEDLYQRKCCATSLVTNVLRFVIALTFIISGISKGGNLDSTSQLINLYCGLLGLDGVFGVSIHIIAATICSFEIFIGILALNRSTFMMMLPIYTLTILGFTILTCINLISPLGGIESCGCFGELIHLNAEETFFKNIVMMIVVVYLTYKHRCEMAQCYLEIKNKAQNLGWTIVYYAIAAAFPICVSVCLDKDFYAHRISLYYASIVVDVILTVFIFKRSISRLSSQRH